MKYECLCVPKQNLPHLIRNSSIKYRKFLGIWLFKNLAPGKSCDDHPVPKKKWRLKIGELNFNFGNIVY